MAVAPRFTAHNSEYLSSRNTGLGNVLFQLASTYGIARKIGKQISYHNLINFGNKLYNIYGLNHKDTIFRNFKYIVTGVNWSGICEKHNREYDPTLEIVCKNNEYTEINGYLECYEYFNDVLSEFVELLRPDMASLTYIRTNYPFLFDPSINTVAIHIRLCEHKSIYNVTFYKKAINYIKERIESPVFLIFTDDPVYDFTDLGISDYKIMTTPYDYMDLWTMSFCKHFICSYSTFCIWACILNTNEDSIILGCVEEAYSQLYNIKTIRPPRSILI